MKILDDDDDQDWREVASHPKAKEKIENDLKKLDWSCERYWSDICLSDTTAVGKHLAKGVSLFDVIKTRPKHV